MLFYNIVNFYVSILVNSISLTVHNTFAVVKNIGDALNLKIKHAAIYKNNQKLILK